MRELLQQVLTDESARTSDGLPRAAARVADDMLPWNDEA